MVTPAMTSSAFAAAISDGDLESAASCWLADAVMVGADGTRTCGMPALREVFQRLISSGAHVVIGVEEALTTPSVALAKTHMTITTPGGSEPLQVTGAVVYIAGDDGWRIAIDRVSLT
jgi:uncharacterized protein (TIGR02246 family)